MFLKCETTLNVYEHNCKTILCRVRLVPATDNNNKGGSGAFSSRCMTADQWDTFDRELKSWLTHNENSVSKTGDNLCQFAVQPNLRVRIRKSKLVIKEFLQIVNLADVHDSYGDDGNKATFPYVLDCILEHTSSMLPAIPSDTEEYEPHPTSSVFNTSSASPLSYVPYTPSKRNRRFHSEYKVKTPGMDMLGYEALEDKYSPKPICQTPSTTNIAQYKPAPIRKRSLSFDSKMSNVNEVILETEDERMPYLEHSIIHLRLKSKPKTNKAFGKYVPQAHIFETHIPAYKPTPIEGNTKKKKQNDSEKDCGPLEVADDQENCFESLESVEYKSSKKKEKRRSKEIDKENENKRSVMEANPSKSKETKKSLNSTHSSEDEFESSYDKRLRKDKVKVDCKMKKTEDRSKQDKKAEDLNFEEYSSKSKKETPNSSKVEQETNGKKYETKEKDDKKKDKSNRRNKCKDVDTNVGDEVHLNKPQDTQLKAETVRIRRSDRSPTKPKRFIEEQEELLKCTKKMKSRRCSPTKSKELFGSDDDDDYFEIDNTNCNAQTPNVANKFSSPLTLSSSSPPSSSKKKRKRIDCEQEKASMNKWLGKKSSSTASDIEKTTTTTSKEKSSSSSRDKSPKKSKSSKKKKKERCKSPSPQTNDIFMPSKEEMEEMRNKHKIQREQNEKMKAALEKMNTPVPKKVEELSLKDMSLNDLLGTLHEYKDDLAYIFEKNHKKDHVKENDGINHYLVIGLIDQRLQLKMLEKLSDIFSSSVNTTHATLYANALLPEWIIRIFMDKYKFSRQQAINHIKDQETYRSYIDVQNESSLLFDD